MAGPLAILKRMRVETNKGEKREEKKKMKNKYPCTSIKYMCRIVGTTSLRCF
jgi:hypothetical protein